METRNRSRPLVDWYDNVSNPVRWVEAIYYLNQLASYRDDSWNTGRGGPPRGQQLTVDEIHKLFAEKDSGESRVYNPEQRFLGDLGGPFVSTKSYVFSDSLRQTIKYVGKVRGDQTGSSYYFGPLWSYNPKLVGLSIPSGSDLNAMGATAIARCKPTNPVANVGTALGELFREGLPSLLGSQLWKDKSKLAKGSAGEYLNYQFGWTPIVSDIKNVAYAAANSDAILSSYERNAGKIVRRRYEFPVEESGSTVSLGPYPGSLPDFDSVWLMDDSVPMPELLAATRTYRKVWFSGAFTYHLPTGYNSRIGVADAAAKASVLLGLELSPDVVWNLMPWSWAVDWFSNAGDVISNLSDWATDGLAMKWGYVMEHIVHTVTYTLSGLSPYGKGGSYASPVVSYYEIKRREKASPFGFGLDWNGLSPRQLAIAAALGITRAF